MRKFTRIIKSKGFAVSVLAAMICLIALASIYIDVNYSRDNVDPAKKNTAGTDKKIAADPMATEPQKTVSSNKSVLPNDEQKQIQITDTPVPLVEKNKKQKNKSHKSNEKKESIVNEVPVAKIGADVKKLEFAENKKLQKPVDGEIIMGYSGDKPVFHKTLGQYKINDATLWSAQLGQDVVSCCNGIVEKVNTTDNRGKGVVIKIGEDYTLTYGQLRDVKVKAGDYVQKGEIIGHISDPTKYYIEEGPNLYLQMKKGKKAIDPEKFIK